MARAKRSPSDETDADADGKVRQSVCPTCDQSFETPGAPEDKHFPFCSRRCQLVDLGKWFDGEHRVSTSFGEEEE